jgi:hypothetical protein
MIYIWRNMMNRKKWLVLCILVVAIGLAGCAYGARAMSSSWSISGSSVDMRDDSWSISARTVNGHATRRLDLSAGELAVLHIESSSGGGSVYAILIQGDNERSTDISGEFYGYIDTSGFEPGRIRLRLQFGRAEDVDLLADWAG